MISLFQGSLLLLFSVSSSAEELETAVEASVKLLLECQESLDGKGAPAEWPYEGVYREDGEIPPGYRVGGTAIAAWALIESPQYERSEDVRAAVRRGLGFVLAGLEGEAMDAGFSGGYDVRGWGHAYALNLMLEMRRRSIVPQDLTDEVDRRIAWLVETLEATEIVERGGWNYSRRGGGEQRADASPFMTAPTVLALWEARRQGEEVAGAVLERALVALEACRTEEGAFAYNTNNGMPTLPGAIARSPIAELVLYTADRSSLEDVEFAVESFFEHWNELEARRKKTGTHKPPHGVAPYYFFYGHYYASVAIEALPEESRRKWRVRYLDTLFSVREDSGGWNDRVFPRSEAFGTSMALLSLLEPTRRRPAAAVLPAASPR